jgi:hypothetical protein
MTGKIFFLHNPKAGGSSLRQVLQSHFRPDEQSPLIENNMVDHEDRHGDYAGFRGFDCYAGHYGHDIFSAVNAGHQCVTNFRHPVTRLLSLYNYFRFNVQLSDEELRTDRYYAVRFAKSAHFKRFIAAGDPRVEVYVRNFHFRQLTNSCWCLKSEATLEEAFRFVDSMPWYYVCEYPDISAFWFRCAFDWELEEIPVINSTGKHGGQTTALSHLDTDTCRTIFLKNELDLALYRYAVSRCLDRSCVESRYSCGARRW